MQMRKFGNTGEQISALGFGCMRFPEVENNGQWSVEQDKVDEMIRTAFENGVNYYDTAPYYCHSNSEKALGDALKGIRDQVLIATKCPVFDEGFKTSDYRRFLEQSLTRLGTDHIDFYHFWSLSGKGFDERVMGLGLLEEAVKAKEEGLIRHISFSFHDEPEQLRRIVETAGIMETVLLQYNLLDRRNEAMMAYAQGKGLGVVAMGPVGGGRLAAPGELYAKLTGKPATATYEIALRFVLGNPHLSCALSGMTDRDIVLKNAAVAADETPMSAEEFQRINEAVAQLEKFKELYCTGCGYCQPCPQNIRIPDIFQLYTYSHVYGLHEYAKQAYSNHLQQGGVDPRTCLECGQCEGKCPQKLSIIKELARVADVLEGK
ncbi:MAG: aldo/keto reductase [Clostridia bacterium]|nr:aldo/keto reductase [Clostridia bacterium]